MRAGDVAGGFGADDYPSVQFMNWVTLHFKQARTGLHS